MIFRILTTLVLLFGGCHIALAQSSGFTYQGKLSASGTVANGTYDIQFKLFDTATVGTGTQQGPTITNSTVVVTAGIFTVQLDFGAGVFSGLPRFLELGVRPGGDVNPYNVLAPRQPVTSTPYAVRSLNSSVADVLSSSCVGCVTSAQVGGVNGSVVTGTIPVAAVPAGSGNYLQNTTSQQAAANFNISGDGTAGGSLSANAVNAVTQYNIGGSRAFTVSNFLQNVFVGLNAGPNASSGGNSFFGYGAGKLTASGHDNSFFGRNAGNQNTESDNSFFGSNAGLENSSGMRNSIFGDGAGRNNQTGSDNAVFGYQAGLNNTASFNSFFGSNAGGAVFNITGQHNTAVGNQAGGSNTLGSFNTAIGDSANFNSNNLDHATAIGAGSVVNSSNTIALGRPDGSDLVEFYGRFQMDTLGPASNPVCFNGANRIGSCSSSLRYKTQVQSFLGGLDIVRRLRPISFTWKEDGLPDLGLGAEEVARVDPRLTFRNKQGEIEGVKYNQVSAVLVNAVQQQQAQITAQQRTIEQQQQQLKRQQDLLQALKLMVCQRNKRAKVCK